MNRPLRRYSNYELIEIINHPERYTEELIRDAQLELAYRTERAEESKPVSAMDSMKAVMFFQTESIVTPAIIWLNIAVFFLVGQFGVDIFSPTSHQLFHVGGMQKYHFLNGEYWRSVSSMFLHGGLMHIGFNMFALLQIGTIAEHLIGSKRYLVIYMICGIFGSLAMITFGGDNVGVGASGAIFGIFGLTYFMLKSPKIKGNKRQIQNLSKQLGFFIMLNIVIGMSSEGISNSAHMGGLVSGAALSFIYLFNYPENIRKIAGNIVAIVLTTVVCFSWVNSMEPELSSTAKFLSLSNEDINIVTSYEEAYNKVVKPLKDNSSVDGNTIKEIDELKTQLDKLNEVLDSHGNIFELEKNEYNYNFNELDKYVKRRMSTPSLQLTPTNE